MNFSVGSPETDQVDQIEQKHSTTAALRIMRKRKNSEKSEIDENSDTEKPLDFCTTKKEENSYFLPFKKLEMTENNFKNQAENQLKTQQNQPIINSAKKRGVAGFSIDDILSHKTAALQQEKQQKAEQLSQPIVRPWDIVAAASANAAAAAHAHSGASPNSSGNSGGGGHFPPSRKSGGSKNQQGGDSSPLDALFQMASKTFEGLKAKSGKLRTFIFNELEPQEFLRAA